MFAKVVLISFQKVVDVFGEALNFDKSWVCKFRVMGDQVSITILESTIIFVQCSTVYS
jgi:hypothetical protein